MASVVTRANGRREIQFRDVNGRRQALRIGKVPKRDADAIKRHVEAIVVSQHNREPMARDTAEWIGEISDDLHAKFVGVGLLTPRASASLGEFVESYVAGRTDLKASTQLKLGQARDHLLGFFNRNQGIRSITRADAADFRIHLLGKGLGENTTRKICGIVKQFMQSAIDRDLIPTNPFAKLPSTVAADPSKYREIPREAIDRLLAAAPHVEWRLIIALSRYGGLRCPSETLSLKWQHIDWANNRITVPSPKTEHHAGGAYRTIPLFPELAGLLSEAFEMAAEGAEFVITRYRDAVTTNLRTQFLKIIKRAGLKPWPRLFHNMRANRQTELENDFPSHVVCAWLGNSEKVARDHYLHVQDAHFERAIQNAQQNAQQPVRDSGVSDGQENQETPAKTGVSQEEPCFAGVDRWSLLDSNQ